MEIHKSKLEREEGGRGPRGLIKKAYIIIINFEKVVRSREVLAK